MKVSHKFFAPFLIAAFVPLVVLGWSARRQVQGALRRVLGGVQVQTAKRAAESVSQYLESIQSALAVAQDHPGFLTRRDAQADVVRSLLDNYSFFGGVTLFGGDLKPVYASARAFDAWDGFGEAWPEVGEAVRRSGFHLSPAVFPPSGPPEVLATVPVGADPARPRGFLTGRVNLLDLCARLRALDVGGGTLLLYDRRERLIAHSSREDLFKKPPPPPGPGPQGEAAREGGRPLWWSREPVEGLGPGAFVVFEQPADVVFREVGELERRLLQAFALSAVLALALCAFATRRVVVAPVAEIQRAVEAIQDRRFNIALTADSGDEIGQLARRVIEAAKTLEKEVRTSTIGVMIQKLSHDLRKPLTTIRGSLDVVRRRGTGSDETAAKHLLYIDQAAAQGLDYIEEMLTLGQDRRPPQKRPTDLNALVKDQLDRMHFPAGVEVAFERGEVPPCPLDAAEAARALSNLVENAVDALPQKSGRVTLRTAARDGRALLTVEDNGRGMPEEVRKRLFDDFFTTREGGTGLGMGIVRRVAERHGGRVLVDSEPGRGTAMTLVFPLEDDHVRRA